MKYEINSDSKMKLKKGKENHIVIGDNEIAKTRGGEKTQKRN